LTARLAEPVGYATTLTARLAEPVGYAVHLDRPPHRACRLRHRPDRNLSATPSTLIGDVVGVGDRVARGSMA
jgi:hypothetical protein